MTRFCITTLESGETIEHRLVDFQLLQPQSRPFAMLRRGEELRAEPIMAYGLFEGSDGEQTIKPLITDWDTGNLGIICDCCHDLAYVTPPYYDIKLDQMMDESVEAEWAEEEASDNEEAAINAQGR